MAVSQTLHKAVDLASKYKVDIVISLVAMYLVAQIRNYFKLSHIPGPWLAGWSDVAQNWATWNERVYQYYYDVNKKYGKIARTGPNSVVSSSPELWMHVNTKPGYKKSEWWFKTGRLEYQKDNIFSQTDTEKHDARRKQVAPGYSGRENFELEGSIDGRVRAFLDLISSKYLSREDAPTVKMDLAKKIQFFTMDVISLVAFGKTFGMLEADEDISGFIQSSDEGLMTGNTFLALNVGWLVQAPFIGRFLGPKVTDKSGFGKMMASCFQYIKERVENAEQDTRRDMLASFCRHGLRGDDLKSEVLEQLVAGSDTTGGGLRGTMLHILATPRVQKKLREEIGAVCAEKTWGDGQVVPNNVVKKMPYLQAVIREGLRVWPPVLGLMPRDVPAGGDTIVIDGKKIFLPGGTCVGVSTLAIHHDTGLYGQDADVFRPERWLTEMDEEKLAAMTRVNDIMFGHGRWSCLGKPVAQMEMNKILFEFFQRFDWALTKPHQPWTLKSGLAGLFVTKDMWVQIMERGG